MHLNNKQRPIHSNQTFRTAQHGDFVSLDIYLDRRDLYAFWNNAVKRRHGHRTRRRRSETGRPHVPWTLYHYSALILIPKRDIKGLNALFETIKLDISA